MTDSKRRRGLTVASALLGGVLVLAACSGGEDAGAGDEGKNGDASQAKVDEAAAEKSSEAQIRITPKDGSSNASINNSATVTVSKGTKVRWVWKGKSLHNVKVTKGPAKFGSPSKTSGSYAKKVKKAGTYTLVCTVHGASDQSMKLVVR